MISMMVRPALLVVLTPSKLLFVSYSEYYHHSSRLVLVLYAYSIYPYANVLARYHYPSPQAPLGPVPNSTLINGLGRFSGGPNSTLAVINVVRGLRYRFRLISISCDPNFVFSIDGHNMVSCLVWYGFIHPTFS